jgi:hypothetical protein
LVIFQGTTVLGSRERDSGDWPLHTIKTRLANAFPILNTKVAAAIPDTGTSEATADSPHRRQHRWKPRECT